MDEESLLEDHRIEQRDLARVALRVAIDARAKAQKALEEAERAEAEARARLERFSPSPRLPSKT